MQARDVRTDMSPPGSKVHPWASPVVDQSCGAVKQPELQAILAGRAHSSAVAHCGCGRNVMPSPWHFCSMPGWYSGETLPKYALARGASWAAHA